MRRLGQLGYATGNSNSTSYTRLAADCRGSASATSFDDFGIPSDMGSTIFPTSDFGGTNFYLNNTFTGASTLYKNRIRSQFKHYTRTHLSGSYVTAINTGNAGAPFAETAEIVTATNNVADQVQEIDTTYYDGYTFSDFTITTFTVEKNPTPGVTHVWPQSTISSSGLPWAPSTGTFSLNGSASYSSFGGGSFYFNGSSNSIAAVDHGNDTFSLFPITLRAQIYPTSTSGIHTFMHNGYNDAIRVRIQSGQLWVRARNIVNGNLTGYTVSPNTWYDVRCSINAAGTQVTLNVNGVDVWSASGTYSDVYHSMGYSAVVFGMYNSSSEHFQGYIRNAKVYK